MYSFRHKQHQQLKTVFVLNTVIFSVGGTTCEWRDICLEHLHFNLQGGGVEVSWWLKGGSSKVTVLLSLCKGVELDLASLFPLPRILSKLSPGFLPSRTSPLLPLQPQPSPRSVSSALIRWVFSDLHYFITYLLWSEVAETNRACAACC